MEPVRSLLQNRSRPAQWVGLGISWKGPPADMAALAALVRSIDGATDVIGHAADRARRPRAWPAGNARVLWFIAFQLRALARLWWCGQCHAVTAPDECSVTPLTGASGS